MTAELAALEERIGYRFRDRKLLLQALTHRSHTQKPHHTRSDNERLEFLGDSILGFVVSERLVERFPGSAEGQLTKLKAYLVRAENLAAVARRLELGSYLRLGRGEEISGGRQKQGLLEDALEALIAAVYLDGGVEAAKGFLDRTILTGSSLEAAEENLSIDNYKSALQEFLQARKMPPPTYEVVEEEGPPHRRTFTMEVGVEGLFSARAAGASKKSAGQRAARLVLEHLKKNGRNSSQPADDDDAGETGEAEQP